MKKNIFEMISVSFLAVSMLISDTSYSAAMKQDVDSQTDISVQTETIEEKQIEPVAIKKIDRQIADVDYTMGAKVIIPEPEPVIEKSSTDETVKSSSKPSNSGKSDSSADKSEKSQSSKKSEPKSDILLNDNIAGKLSDRNHVPCGGLWEYYYDNFYAREINCNGSGVYLDISKGQKVSIAGKVCEMVGSQNLNYHSNTMSDVVWYGNTIVQTCYYGNRGKVRLVSFNCV